MATREMALHDYFLGEALALVGYPTASGKIMGQHVKDLLVGVVRLIPLL